MEIGNKYNGWTIEDFIGEGSFGKVYKTSRSEFGYTYESALKVIKIPQSQAEVDTIRNDGMDEKSITSYFESIVEDIAKELNYMYKLKGFTNIVSYEDHQITPVKDGIGWEIFIRMELLTPLFNYVRTNSFTENDILRLGIDICTALEICRKFDIIHRDIKPENIFVSCLGDFELGDFGIARQLEKTASDLSKKGTYTYMAPEVYLGKPYNATVDIYSLGIVLYRFFNNNRTPFLPPFPEPIKYTDKEQANLMRMSGTAIPKPSNADDRISDIILKACAFNPDERYQTPTEMKAALLAALNKTEITDDTRAFDKDSSQDNIKTGDMPQQPAEDIPEHTVSIFSGSTPFAKKAPETGPEKEIPEVKIEEVTPEPSIKPTPIPEPEPIITHPVADIPKTPAVDTTTEVKPTFSPTLTPAKAPSHPVIVYRSRPVRFCSHCGNPLADPSKECSVCGSRLCIKCGARVHANASICSHCGAIVPRTVVSTNTHNSLNSIGNTGFKTCSNCGASVSASSSICSCCGHSFSKPVTLSKNEWYCTRCGRTNSKYVGTCACGNVRPK